MPTFARRSGRLQAARVAPEATWGVDPATGGLEMQIQDYVIPAFEQAVLPRNDAVRTTYMVNGPLAGVKGGAGPKLKMDLCSALASRASAGTDAVPDPVMAALWGAVLGEGAGSNSGAYEAGKGRVGGGSTVVSINAASGTGQLTAITITTGESARFNVGDCIVVVHSGVAYPMIVTAISAGPPAVLTVACGPHVTTSAIAEGDLVLGTWSKVIPATGTNAGINKSLTTELVDDIGKVYRWTGCSGNASIEGTAGGKVQVNFDFMADSWPTPGSLSATLASGSTSWPQDARKRIAGVDTLIRIGAAGEGGTSFPYTLLQDYESYDGFALDLGVTRADVADVSGAQGRAARPIIAVEPKLTLRGYMSESRLADLGVAGALPVFRAVSIACGDTTNGGWALLIPNAQLSVAPTHADKSGHVGQELVFQPAPHSGGFAPFYLVSF